MRLIVSRRDVRGNRFTDAPIDDAVFRQILEAAHAAPSVGFSQPWRFVIVKDPAKREEIYREFVRENEKAKTIFRDRPLYPELKLEGIREAYANIAVLCRKPSGAVLGQTTQARTGEYSVVCAIQNLWLMARSHGIGIGWVSILRKKKVKKILGISDEYKLVAYLSIGYVSDFPEEPELLTLGWERKKSLEEVIEWV